MFAPFTLEALKREGSHVVFSSKDFPGTIPDHIVVSQKMVAKQPKVAQKIVNAWYDTLAYMDANPREVVEDHGRRRPSISTADYEDLAERHEALHGRRGGRRRSSPVTRSRRWSTPPA